MKLVLRLVLGSLATIILACNALNTSAATRVPTSSADPELLHYENSWLSFDYPRTFALYSPGVTEFRWHPDVDLGGELVVALGDSRYQSRGICYSWIRISRHVVCTCDSLEKAMDEAYSSISPEFILYDSPFPVPELLLVSGQDALQKNYRIFWGEPAFDLRDIWFRQRENVFVVSTSTRWSNSDDLVAFNSMVNRLLSGLILK